MIWKLWEDSDIAEALDRRQDIEERQDIEWWNEEACCQACLEVKSGEEEERRATAAAILSVEQQIANEQNVANTKQNGFKGEFS